MRFENYVLAALLGAAFIVCALLVWMAHTFFKGLMS